ncbi:MAG: phosphotransferase, partial [Gaiellaceae bacterium]
DVNEVWLVDGTVRRPVDTWSPAVHALLGHLDGRGAPRFVGFDEEGRERLEFVEGEAASGEEDVMEELGALLRRLHEAQAGFARPAGVRWFFENEGPIVCHNDLFPPNVILRDGLPVALIDWDLAAPGEPLDDVASAAYHWAPLKAEAGPTLELRGRRLRELCDGYGLEPADRSQLLDVTIAQRDRGYELHARLGGTERLPGWREMWDGGSGERIRANQRWIVEQREELESWLV